MQILDTIRIAEIKVSDQKSCGDNLCNRESNTMIKSGLVSITFRQLSVPQILNLAADAGFKGIEWGGDVHVPQGDIEQARKVFRQTFDKNLEITAYGSYFQIGKSRHEGLAFETVLRTAEALQAPMIRVWAGNRNSEAASIEYKKRIIDESKHIADMAASKGIKIVYEFHERTLTNTPQSCRELLEAVNHPYVFTYWQPVQEVDTAENCTGINILLPWIAGFHVFHWESKSQTRYLLSTGADDWFHYLERFKGIESQVYGLIEFVKDDKPENFLLDAETLKLWLKGGDN